MIDHYLDFILSKAESMKVFADGEKSFVLGEWRQWRAACIQKGEFVNPKEFKKNSLKIDKNMVQIDPAG